MSRIITNKDLHDMKVTRRTNNRIHAFGYTDFNTKKKTIKIQVNKKKSKQIVPGEVLATLHHEETHLKHPNMKEKNVRKEEAKAHKLTPKQKQKLYNLYR
ncbi:MAG: hypothetical protein KGI08_03280 [Thaumarchaeota archaeon]|nr:hypothetical protein [Nitrososphaerota archaeon]